MTVIKKWRVYCTDEETYHTVLLEEEDPAPTKCPINTNHSIQDNLTQDETEYIITQSVILEEEESMHTQGYYRSNGHKIEINANVDAITSYTINWPYDVTILNGWFNSQDNQVGDNVSLVVAPNTVTGYLTNNISSGNNIISVSQTVIDNMAIGFCMSITDGVNIADLGEVSSIDIDTNSLTTTVNSSHSFLASSPTYVKQSINLIDELEINVAKTRYAFAEKKQRGKGLPANTDIEVLYKNVSGGEKTFSFNIEIIY